MQHIIHTFAPVFSAHSKILILGTMPSPKSREGGFYYGHAQNRFWRVLSGVLGEPCPKTNEEKAALLLGHDIALWDVLSQCDIRGAEDASIRNPVPNDIASLIAVSQIRAVFANGKKAQSLYDRFVRNSTQMPTIQLPSTSPANASYPIERLIGEYSRIKAYLSGDLPEK